MKRIDWILIILIVFTWLVEDLYHLAPRSTKIFPFPFADEGLSFRWYIFEICNYVRFGTFAVCCLIIAQRFKMNWLVLDTIKMTVVLVVFSLLWFLIMYNNPFYKSEIWIKFIVVGLIYLSILSIRWHGKRNSSFFGVGSIRRMD